MTIFLMIRPASGPIVFNHWIHGLLVKKKPASAIAAASLTCILSGTQIKASGPRRVEMNAIEAVVEVVKANEELTETLDSYESWFESLVGKTLIIEQRNKNKTRFVTAEVEEFEEGEGWLAHNIIRPEDIRILKHDGATEMLQLELSALKLMRNSL